MKRHGKECKYTNQPKQPEQNNLLTEVFWGRIDRTPFFQSHQHEKPEQPGMPDIKQKIFYIIKYRGLNITIQ
jgi:hypothetical protein